MHKQMFKLQIYHGLELSHHCLHTCNLNSHKDMRGWTKTIGHQVCIPINYTDNWIPII